MYIEANGGRVSVGIRKAVEAKTLLLNCFLLLHNLNAIITVY